MLQSFIMSQVTAINNAGIHYIGPDLWAGVLLVANVIAGLGLAVFMLGFITAAGNYGSAFGKD